LGSFGGSWYKVAVWQLLGEELLSSCCGSNYWVAVVAVTVVEAVDVAVAVVSVVVVAVAVVAVAVVSVAVVSVAVAAVAAVAVAGCCGRTYYVTFWQMFGQELLRSCCDSHYCGSSCCGNSCCNSSFTVTAANVSAAVALICNYCAMIFWTRVN